MATVPAPTPPGAIVDSATDQITTRPWGISPAERAEVLQALRFEYFKWDTYACGGCLVLDEAVVLSRQAHEEVVRATEGLHRGLQRFEQRVRRDSEALTRLAIPEALHPLIAAEQHDTLQIARYDLFPTEDGRWMVSEFNEDVPGGFNEAAGLPALLGNMGPDVSWEGDLRASFVDAFDDYPSVALLYATAFSEDLQHMLILERWLADAGHRTVLGSPAHLRPGWRRPRILGTAIDAAVRFYPAEWMPQLPNLNTWLRLGPRLPMMNPVHRLVRQSKSMFELWQEDRYLDEEDRDLIARHCPHTEAFTAAKVPMLMDEQRRWVVKKAFGRMGDFVVIGDICTPTEWEATLLEASRQPGNFCIQERFAVKTLDFAVGPMYPAIGAFLVNGRFAGYYSRAAARPLITHEAYHVATLVHHS